MPKAGRLLRKLVPRRRRLSPPEALLVEQLGAGVARATGTGIKRSRAMRRQLKGIASGRQSRKSRKRGAALAKIRARARKQ